MPDALALVPSEVRQPPTIPYAWDYDRSVAEVKQLVYKWKNLNAGIADELWVARNHLSKKGPRNGAHTWAGYCADVGTHYTTINRWLLKWFSTAQNDANASIAAAEIPVGTFATIVIDPPWQYGNSASRNAAKKKYPTMTMAQLEALEIPAAPNAHIYLWTTNGFLREAFDLMDAWGFAYKTLLTWVKPQMGMGNYFRVNTEHVLFGLRGTLPTMRKDCPTAFEAPRTKHSQKPDTFYDLVESISPGPYLEMFARRVRLGWEGWGNECYSAA